VSSASLQLLAFGAACPEEQSAEWVAPFRLLFNNGVNDQQKKAVALGFQIA
jgi:hypothetical protein